MINSAPILFADFRPHVAHGGPRESWDGLRFEKWCTLHRSQLRRPIIRNVVLCVFGARKHETTINDTYEAPQGQPSAGADQSTACLEIAEETEGMLMPSDPGIVDLGAHDCAIKPPVVIFCQTSIACSASLSGRCEGMPCQPQSGHQTRTVPCNMMCFCV